MKAIRAKAPDGLNNPNRWNQNLRPWFNVERYQQWINDRIGLNKDGRPIILLRWAQEVTTRCYGEEIPRYWVKRGLAGNGKHIYYTVPRWVFEIRNEPETYVDSWNATRYALKDPTQGGGHRCGDCGSSGEPELINGKLYCRSCVSTNITGGVVIDKGPPPSEFYSYMMECAEHESVDPSSGWAACCTRAFYDETKFGSAGSRCWGEYRPPSDFDLEVISQAARQMEANPYRNPYRALTPTELLEIELAANKQTERAQEVQDQLGRAIREDFIKQHGWRLFETDPGVLHHGRQHDVGKSVAIGEANKMIELPS